MDMKYGLLYPRRENLLNRTDRVRHAIDTTSVRINSADLLRSILLSTLRIRIFAILVIRLDGGNAGSILIAAIMDLKSLRLGNHGLHIFFFLGTFVWPDLQQVHEPVPFQLCNDPFVKISAN